MRWYLKAAAFNLLSVMPGGKLIYRLLQDRVTRTTAVTTETVAQKMEVANVYLDHLRAQFGIDSLRGLTHADIGAGWMPTIPLVFYAAGCERQILCDIEANIRAETAAEVVSKVRDLAASDARLGRHCHRLPPALGQGEALSDYFARIGLRYFVPYDIHALASEPDDKLITCTQVLMHLSVGEMRTLLSGIRRALDPGGVFLASVHLHDLYADKDPRLSPYNRWRYSPIIWDRLVNSKLMSYNRVTASGYRKLVEEAGLELLTFDVDEPTEGDLIALQRVPLHHSFRHIPPRELAARHLFMATKSSGSRAPFPRLSPSR